MHSSDTTGRAPDETKRIDFPVDEVTVSVGEETGKSVFIDRDYWACINRGFGVRKHDTELAHLSLFGPDLSSRLARPSRD